MNRGYDTNFRGRCAWDDPTVLSDGSFRIPPFTTPPPPVLPPIIAASCGATVQGSLSNRCAKSLYREPTSIGNQRYFARLCSLTVASPGLCEVLVSSSEFTPYVTMVRSGDLRWTNSGGLITVTLTPEQAGPMVIEVSSVEPYATGAFDVHVTCGAALLAYYTCDEDTPITILEDSFGLFDLDKSVGVDGTSRPGKISTALQIGQLGGGAGNTTWTNGPDEHWVCTDFTVRFWYNFGAVVTVQEAILWTDQFTIYRDDSYAGPKMTFWLQAAGQWLSSVPTFDVGSGWHRIVAWFEEGVGLGLKIDDETSTTHATTDPLDTVTETTLSLRSDNDLYDIIDEIAIWNRKLTDAELTTDWNSGSGKTYPDVPTV